MKKKLFHFYLLSMFFCSHLIYGQSQFAQEHQLFWLKSLKTKEANIGFNYNTALNFKGEYPILNKKFAASAYSYVFYVLKSNEASQRIFSLFNEGDLHSFYTDSIKSDLTLSVDLNKLNKGAIVNFNFYNKAYRNKKSQSILYVENIYNRSKTELYEILICNTCSEDRVRDQIQTYLALKYGITLQQKNKYFDARGTKIWDEDYNPDFNNHIIGLAREDYFEFEQKASYNNEDRFMMIKKAVVNEEFKDQTYVLLADNNAPKEFVKNKGEFKRKWLLQNNGNHPVRFDIDLALKPDRKAQYVLYTSQGKEIARDETDTVKLSFKDLIIEKGSRYYLSLGQITPFEIEMNQDTLGINTRQILSTNSQGIPPYYITAIDLKSQVTYSFVSSSSTYHLQDLPTSVYSLEVIDAEGKIAKIDSVELDFSSNLLVDMPSIWQLNNRDLLEVKPTVRKIGKQLMYQWYFGDKRISTASILHVNYPGDFILEVIDINGKKEKFKFSVMSKTKEIKDEEIHWFVTPNPVLSGQDFKVHYFFETPKQVEFYIYTLEGKFILKKDLGIIEGGEFPYKLIGRTTYLLVSIINKKTSIEKLIVK